MYKRILVPLDGSELAEAILPAARAVAERGDASLILLRIIPPAALRASADAEASEYLNRLADSLKAAGLKASAEVRMGIVADTILDFAEDARMDLIAMSTHGRGGLSRLLMGSVADKVVRNGHLPVLLTRPDGIADADFNLKRILTPVDGSLLAESALIHAQQLAQSFDADILLLSVWESAGYKLGSFPETEIEMKMQEMHSSAKHYIIDATHRLQGEGLRARWKLASGPVAPCILDTARTSGANLIVMATHGLTGISRVVEGSVADEVLRASPVPMLLVRSNVA